MAWQFTGRGSPVLIADPRNYAGVTVIDPISGGERSLKYLSPYESHKTLGHYKEPAGTQKEQYRQLKKKSDASVEFMRTCHLTREEAWTYYYACYLPGIGYALANSYITEAQLTNIQRKAMSIIYSKCGYNRNTKKEILFGPIELGGANFRHLYDQQGIGQIQLFLYHWRNKTQAGRLLRCAVAWAQYCAGISTPIFEDVHTPIDYLESRWLLSLRKFLAKIDARIQVDQTGVPPLERENDAYIMDHIMAGKQFSTQEIQSLNYCRMYLGALTIADLTTSKGDRLDNTKLFGSTSLLSTTTKWMKVNQDRPNDSAWKLWKKANTLWSYENGSLRQPLGEWKVDSSTSRIQHFAYATMEYLYVRVYRHEYKVYRRGRTHGFATLHRALNLHNISNRATPVEIEDYGSDRWRITHRTKISPARAQPAIATFTDYINSLEAWEVDLLMHTELIADAYTICLELQQSFAAGSDGSVMFGTDGAFGWTLSNLDGERAAQGMGPSRGSVMNSYRAECSGMLSILRFLVRLAEFTVMDGTWTGTIGTDSQSMLDTLFGRSTDSGPTAAEPTSLSPDATLLNPLIPEWDLLFEIRNTLLQLPSVKLVYVKGHQDRTCSYNRLNLLAQLNVDADDKAREYQERFGQARPYALLTQHSGAFLVYPEGTRTANYGHSIRSRATSNPLRTYIKQKHQFDDSTMEMIDWNAHGSAMRKHIKQRIRLTKMVHECLPTLKHLNRQDNGRRTCPGCKRSQCEDRDHIIKCNSDSRASWRHKFIASLETFHERVDTYGPLRYLLNDAIAEWMQSEDDDMILHPSMYHNDVRSAKAQQNAIGWRQVFSGRFGQEWSRIQDDYYARDRRQRGANDKRNGTKWQVQLITHIWKEWTKLWKLRNEELHGRDCANQQAIIRSNVERELQSVYDNRNHYEPRVQELLGRDIQEQLQRPTWVTRNWLTVNIPVFRASMQRTKNKAIAGVRSIRSYFEFRHPES